MPFRLFLYLLLTSLLPSLAAAQNTLRTIQPPAPPGGPLTLSGALQTGLGQSLLLQAGALEVERQRALTRTAYDLPRTVLDYQVGQISGPLRDHSFNLVQQVAFPTLYGAQRRLLTGQVAVVEQRVQVQRRELALRISLTYYDLLLNYRQAALLRRQDSLYRRAARAARIRYQVGETNRLEQVSAEARLRELQQRLRVLLTETQVQRQQLSVLLNLGQPAAIDTATAPLAPAPDSAGLAPDNNPTLALLAQEVAVSRQQTRVEELRRLPDLRAGYFYQTINQERGFQVAQAGIAVPLVGGAVKNRIRAARLGEQAAEAQLQYVQAQLTGQLAALRRQLRQAQASVAYYQQTALPQAQLVLSTAEKSFRAGDIDYVEYVVNTEPAWQIQQAYLTQVRQYNELALTLTSLTTDQP